MKKINNPYNLQSGITVLLAVFIVAGVALITITVSVLAIQGIRNSRSVTLSEPAVGQATGGAEEGVWSLKRNVTLPDCTNNATNTTNQGETGTTGINYSARSYCKSYGPATFDVSATSPYTFYLFDPYAPNGCGTSGTPTCADGSTHPVDLSGMSNGGYHTMTITLNSGSSNLNVYTTRLDGSQVGIQPLTVSTGNTITITGLNGTTGNDNRVQVKLEYCPTACTDPSASVTINTDQGMPTFPTVASTGCAQKGNGTGNSCTSGEVYNRRIEVTVPTQ